MAFTYDLTTLGGQTRLLIPDAVEETMTFDDAEIAAFLVMTGNDPYLAAATALETIAASEAMVGKKMAVFGTITTDGTAVSAALLARAQRLREAAGSQDGGEYVGVASTAVDEWTWRELT